MFSMTGFGSREIQIKGIGRFSLDLKSSNHKFLEIVCHLPERFIYLEGKIKKEIEARVKRGRVTCALNVLYEKTPSIFINRALIKNYIYNLKSIQRQFKIKDTLSLQTLISLPGVLSLTEDEISRLNIWPKLKVLLGQALSDLVKMRQKEGLALSKYLKKRDEILNVNVMAIKRRFKKAVRERLKLIDLEEEKASFVKNSDITEEIERLSFHIKNFKSKLNKNGQVGKELDFIAQEMQREANTLAAKTFDTVISARVVQVRSQIDKIREQVQNIE